MVASPVPGGTAYACTSTTQPPDCRAHAAAPASLIPSAFALPAGIGAPTCVAVRGFVPFIEPTATTLSLPPVLPVLARWIW